MKKLTGFALALVFVVSGSASAQTSVDGQLPAGYTICRTKALAPNAAPVNSIRECDSVSPAILGRLARMQTALNAQRASIANAQKTAEAARDEAEVARSIASRAEDTAKAVGNRVATVEQNDKAQDSDIAANTARIEALEQHDATQDGRLDDVEARLGTVENMFPRLSLKTGLTALVGAGGDSYAGFPLVAELRLPVAEKLALDIEGGASVAFGDNPLGVVARLGLTYQISDKVHVGPGLVAYGVGLDSSLDSSVMFTGVDGRIEYNPKGMLVVGADIMPLGTNVSGSHGAKYAFGGTAFVGARF